jgi:hypothetical protein
MTIPADPQLWLFCEEYINGRCKRMPNLYREYRIRKEYRHRGGEFEETTIDEQRARELLERWVQVIPFLKSGKVIDCTAATKHSKAARPLTRLDPDTPVTLPELLKMHDRKSILNMARRKNKNPKKRVRWEDLEFH